jgi:hypothetical protein
MQSHYHFLGVFAFLTPGSCYCMCLLRLTKNGEDLLQDKTRSVIKYNERCNLVIP